MSAPMIVAFLIALGMTQYQAVCEDISVLESIAQLLSNRPSHLPWIPSVAYDEEPKNEYQQRQFNKDKQYETQLELILAELQVQLLGTAEAQRFFQRATVYGLPSFENLRFFDNYIVSYDDRLKQPTWSLEYYYGKRMTKYGRLFRHGRYYFPDMSIHQYFRSADADFENTDYFRGHFTAAFDVPSNRRIMLQSFQSSNVAPMMYNIYRINCLWNRLETYCNYLARRSKHVYIITGTLYLPAADKMSYATIGINRIAVPNYFYKIVLHESKGGTVSIEAFLVPNCKGPDMHTTLDPTRLDVMTELPKIEKLTRLKFFDLLDRKIILKPAFFKYGFEDRLPRC